MNKKSIVLSIMTLLLSASLPAFAASDQLIDVNVYSQNYEAVNTVVNEYRIMSGFEDNTFRGDKPIDRYAYSVVLINTIELLNRKMDEIEQAKLMDTTPSISNESLKYVNIPDLSKEHWAYNKSLTLLQLGLIRTYSDNTFQGTRNVSYAGFAIGLGRLMSVINDMAPPVLQRKWQKEKNNNVRLVKEVPPGSPVYEPFKLAMEYNLIDYKPNISYLTKDISRYEVAEYLTRLINKLDELRKYMVFTRIG